MDVNFSKAANAYANAANMKGGIGGVLAGGDDGIPDKSFSDVLGDALNKSINTGYKNEAISNAAVAGKAELHQLVTAVADADLTIKTIVAVRDRAVSAYQDIIKMPI